MSEQHPIVAVTGSSGAGTSSVTTAFRHIFERENLRAAWIEGDSFHRHDRAAMAVEVERAAGEGRTLTHFGPDGNLFDQLVGLFSDYAARGDVLQNRAQLGLAFRETDRNRVNALAKIEHKFERDASNALTGELRSAAWVLSTHADWQPSRPWWLSGRAAAKWQRDRFEGGVPSSFAAQLLAARLVYDITEDWDLGLMAAAQFGQRGARQTALGVEAGYLLKQNLWLSFGFNASGFAGDADLVGYEYTRAGAYVRLRFKFDEDLFRSNTRSVNRTLDRDPTAGAKP